MEHLKIAKSLKNEWLDFHQENPKIRIRDAARTLQTTEAEIVASFVGNKAMRLNNDFKGLWKRMPELGYIMTLTRNESCVHERKGIFENIQVAHAHVGYVAGPDIDLRMFFKHWAFGFALFDDEEAGFKKSIQIFDHQGTAITKIYLQATSNHDRFELLVRDFLAENQTNTLDIKPEEGMPKDVDGNIDIQAFLKSWSDLKDTHDFYPMLLKYKISRLRALHIGGSFTKKVSNKSAEILLEDVSKSGMPIMVFTSSKGNVQIHTGPVKKIVKIPGWVNVMDSEFNLHLHSEDIAESWVVRKPNLECDVHSLECYDRAGNLIVQFFGKRKPGIPEDKEWTKYITSLIN